jgi:uncharacterized protein (TIGR02453 family)
MTVPSRPFRGFGEKALPFLRALGFHQNREWFQENKALYEREVYEPLCALVSGVNEGCIARGLPLRGSPKASIFRIHRDVRFARDKSPFKTHASAVLTRSGTKGDPGLFYIHVSPGDCLLGAGFHDLEPLRIAAFRRHIVADPGRLRGLLAALAGQGLALDAGWSLKRAPREAAGIDDEIVVGALKLKSFITKKSIADERINTAELVGDCLDHIESSMPLLEYGWSALAALDPMRD